MAECVQCGVEIGPHVDVCTACGATQHAPTWPLAALVVCWVAWIAALPAAQAGSPFGIVALLAVVASLVLLWVDATNAKEADELEIEYPVAVPIVVLLLWALALPAYVVYRFVKR